jgi:hypothetical protein
LVDKKQDRIFQGGITVLNTSLSVSSCVRSILPDVLVKYLWQLALSDEFRTCENQTFMLEPRELGGRDVQDIFHSYELSSFGEWRSVFGITPVKCKLRILNSEDGYQMLVEERDVCSVDVNDKRS